VVIPPDVADKGQLAVTLGAKGVSCSAADLAKYGTIEATIGHFAGLGLDICQVGGWALNPLVPTDEGVEAVEDAIQFAAQVGPHCTVVLGAGGLNPHHAWVAHPDNWTRASRERVAEVVRPLAEIAEEHGVRLALEPHFANVAKDGPTSAELLGLIGSRGAGMCIDMVNYCTYEGFWNTPVLIDSILEPLKGRCCAAHLKDVSMEQRLIIHMNECPAGQGEMDFVHLLARLDEVVESDDWAIIEHTPADMLEGAFAYVREKAAEAGVTFR
jgi:sugar phosphate isomerase/epimerase